MALQLAIAAVVPLLGLAGVPTPPAPDQTRGVGIYPGDPKEDFAPTLAPDSRAYRNLALRRAVYQSSSYDYNLTAQLVTDGIRQATPPRRLATATSESGIAGKVERELVVDGNTVSGVMLSRPPRWLQLELRGGDAAPEIDRIELEARPRPAPRFGPQGAGEELPPPEKREWTALVEGGDDGHSWRELGRASGRLSAEVAFAFSPFFSGRGPTLRPIVRLEPPARLRFYRITLDANLPLAWNVAEVELFAGERRLEIGGPQRFDSAWMSEGSGEEWVMVDLGSRSTIDEIALFWIHRAAAGTIEVSDDAGSWRAVGTLDAAAGPEERLRLAPAVEARYVRARMTRPSSGEGYALSELEVYGRGGLVPQAKPLPPRRADGRQDLAGGAWKLQRDSLVSADGQTLSQVGFADGDWVVATVPATVLSSYWNVGAVPDPNHGANQLAISDSFFHADFWYRTEFTLKRRAKGERTFLHFDGVNWKAEVYLNGERLGRVEGAFTRGRFDVTERLKKGVNAVAVRVEKNATPGSAKQKTLEAAGLNGGALGADNPTYHASIGWDWIPTVRGRASGLWNDVYLSRSGPVTIDEPFVSTTLPLPDTSSADVRIEAILANHTPARVSGVLRGRFGEARFEQVVTIEGASSRTLVLDPRTHPALRLVQPRLWWPNGYGEPHLHDVELTFVTDGRLSDRRAFQAGVRQYTYSEEGGALRLWVNGRRFIARGGNWGFPETNLRYRGREYDAAVRYHRDMNFTMIRNWVGQTGDDELFEACDRHGIVVWQDFWLANPFDGPDPRDEALFLANARDFVRRIRNHPSVGLYCGRNEGRPPETLDKGLRALVSELQPAVHYISDSAADVVSGGGPYGVQTPKFYFRNRATTKLHSELGMPNIVSLDSLKQMLPEASLWPPGLGWGLHDFNLGSAQRLGAFRSLIDSGYGGADDAESWTSLAQLVNYDGYRAMFEAQSRNRMGLLLWMSHPAWPSFVWQTYDYYLEPTAGYFGAKKGAEPLHIQWNAASDEVEVVNHSAGRQDGLLAKAEILGLDGAVRWERTAAVDSGEDSVVTPFRLEFPAELTAVHFVRLRLTRGEQTLSENFYWRGVEEGNYRALRTLPNVEVRAETRVERQGERYELTTDLGNAGRDPALMLRLVPVRAESGDRILPALFSDNFVALMPGERRTIRTSIEVRDARGETPRIELRGLNLAR